MSRRVLKSLCCGAPVVGMVDVTVHPRLYIEDGKVVSGAITDRIGAVRWAAEQIPCDMGEAYCDKCGEFVDVAEASS